MMRVLVVRWLSPFMCDSWCGEVRNQLISFSHARFLFGQLAPKKEVRDLFLVFLDFPFFESAKQRRKEMQHFLFTNTNKWRPFQQQTEKVMGDKWRWADFGSPPSLKGRRWAKISSFTLFSLVLAPFRSANGSINVKTHHEDYFSVCVFFMFESAAHQIFCTLNFSDAKSSPAQHSPS